jgi:hypothetical protein
VLPLSNAVQGIIIAPCSHNHFKHQKDGGTKSELLTDAFFHFLQRSGDLILSPEEINDPPDLAYGLLAVAALPLLATFPLLLVPACKKEPLSAGTRTSISFGVSILATGVGGFFLYIKQTDGAGITSSDTVGLAYGAIQSLLYAKKLFCPGWCGPALEEREDELAAQQLYGSVNV